MVQEVVLAETCASRFAEICTFCGAPGAMLGIMACTQQLWTDEKK